MTRVKGNETQVVSLHGENRPERAGDLYGIDGEAFSGFHVLQFFQV